MRAADFFKNVVYKPPFSRLHPQEAVFLYNLLKHEKIRIFGNRHVLNTHFPPYPSGAFDNLVDHFRSVGEPEQLQLYSVTLAVTNRCNYNCWHCYNAGRSQEDMPFEALARAIRELQAMGAVMVTLTGGEPLLRQDLEQIVGLFSDRTCLTLNTTGAGLTCERARSLRAKGLFAAGISIDSHDPLEHDRLRGTKGAFETAANALAAAAGSGLYPYIVTVATRDLLRRERFTPFLDFAKQAGALEIHLLEPAATGRLQGKTEVILHSAERRKILKYQRKVAKREDLPTLSSLAYIESPDAFGCGAGLTHLYVDGSGEVCPCNLIPLSFGNAIREPLREILPRMREYFRRPRTGCVGRLLARHLPAGKMPCDLETSRAICEKFLPRSHPVPRFFAIRAKPHPTAGAAELRTAYDEIHEHYDEFWLKEAGKSIEELISRIPFDGTRVVFEAGCGTGYATVRLARRVAGFGEVIAVDLSDGMLQEARRRVQAEAIRNVRFVLGDALEVMRKTGSFDLIFTSWVLGYIPLEDFFRAAWETLRPKGQVAFVVHKDNSPREPLEIVGEILAEDPNVFEKQVLFHFPHDLYHVRSEVERAGLSIDHLWEGSIAFRYEAPDQLLEHLLKSGAGTAYYDAVDPRKRSVLKDKFLDRLARRCSSADGFRVTHDYVACIASKPAL